MARITESDYNNVLTPILTIKTPDNSQTLLEQDFSNYSNSQLKITRMSISNAIQKTGELNLEFMDDIGFMNRHEIFKGCRCYVKAKKAHQSEYQNLFAGLLIDETEQESSNALTQYALTFKSMRHIFTHTIVNYERNVPFKNLKEDRLNLVNNDPNYYIGAIVKDILTNISILPNYNGLTLQERGNFTLNGIDTETPLTLPAIRYIGMANELFDQITDISGFIFGDDEDNDIYFRPPTYKSKGHILKLDWNDYLTDDPTITMIASNPVVKSSTIDPGSYAEVILAKAFDNSVLVNNSSTNNFLSLYNKDLAVQVNFRTTKLPYLTLMLSKNKAGTNAPDPSNAVVVGFVATDENNNIGPDIVATFQIPLRYIPATPAPVTRVHLDFTGTGSVDTSKNYWLVLQEIGDSEENTVLWWHDNGLANSQGQVVRSKRRDLPYGRGSTRAYNPVGWLDITEKYLFSLTFTTQKPILHISKSIISRTQYLDPAPVETIQNPDIQDSKTLQQFLGLANDYSSRIPISYDFGRVSISDKLIRPGYALLYVDNDGNDNQVNIRDTTYEFTSNGDELPFGARNVILQGIGYQLSREFFNSETFYNQFYCNPVQ